MTSPALDAAPDPRAPDTSREPQPARAASGPVEALRSDLEVTVDAAAPLAPSGGSLRASRSS